jgi:tetratricopeptide (TPR) repeat protein
MIEVAFVSGQLGKVLYDQGGVLYAFGPGSEPQRASIGELCEVLRRGSEYEIVSNTGVDALKGLLQDRVQKHDTLFLSISLLDADLSLSARITVAQAVEEMLGNGEAQEFVSRRLMSIPMPVESRSHRHRVTGPISSFTVIKALFDNVFDSQSTLDELWGAWEETLDEYKIEESTRPALVTHIVDSGFFLDVLRAIQSKDLHRFNSVIVDHTLRPETSAALKTSQSVLTTFRSKVHSRFFAGSGKASQRQLRLKRVRPPVRTAVLAEPPDSAEEPMFDLGVGVRIPHRTVGAFEAKARVDKQIAAIRDVLFAGKNALAERYLQELIGFQLGQGDREHAVMSLCALAAISLDANQLQMADSLSEFALKLSSDDPFVYTTRAEVFKQRGHFYSALKAYEEAIQRFPRERYARDGYADVLKEMGSFDESIRLYKEVQKLFPDDPVAFNGEVGVLKAKGELRTALKLAVANAKRFEYDGVIRASLAGCLASLGKYEESLRHYKVALSIERPSMRTILGYIYTLKSAGKLTDALAYTDSLIARLPPVPSLLNAKATLLRSANRLEESLGLFEEVIMRFPTYTPAKFGAAIVRIMQNEPEQAQRVLPDEDLESELDWFAYRVLALSYVRMENYEQAVSKLSMGIEKCPWLKERMKLQAALGFVALQRKDVTRSVQLLQKDIDRLEDREKQTRFIFLAHAHAEGGSVGVAKIILGSLFTGKDPELVALRIAINDNYNIGLNLGTNSVIAAVPLPAQIATAELSLSMAA